MRVEKHHTEAGGGLFELPDVTIGILHDDQPDHRISVGGDRRAHAPLLAEQGWVMPAGAVGRCEYDAPLRFTTVRIPEPLLLRLAGTLAGLDAGGGARLYREPGTGPGRAHRARAGADRTGPPRPVRSTTRGCVGRSTTSTTGSPTIFCSRRWRARRR